MVPSLQEPWAPTTHVKVLPPVRGAKSTSVEEATVPPPLVYRPFDSKDHRMPCSKQTANPRMSRIPEKSAGGLGLGRELAICPQFANEQRVKATKALGIK